MKDKNDRIFQLSLTEIAFIISFILLLLLGYLVNREQLSRERAEAALLETQHVSEMQTSLTQAKENLVTELKKAGSSNPEEVITKLVAAEQVRSERDTLKQKVEQLDERLTALTALQAQIDKAANSGKPQETKEFIESALLTTAELKKQLKEQLSKDLTPGEETKTIKALVQAAKTLDEQAAGGKGVADFKTENADLRGQVAFLKKRLDARGGRDFPPCWADENGKIEFLFAIELKNDSVVISPAWPAKREAAARALPGMEEILSTPHSHRDFERVTQGVFRWSTTQDPECRHYVQLKSSISDAVMSDRARLMVENYFYKIEARR